MTAFICGPADGPILTIEDLEAPGWCCAGQAMADATRCTCWEPVYDLEQEPARTDLPAETRPTMCGDCAFQPDSPERLAGDVVEGLPNFWCHRGMKRPRIWRHPDGRERPGSPADYDPLIVDGIPYRADGRPAARCGGWALHQAITLEEAAGA